MSEPRNAKRAPVPLPSSEELQQEFPLSTAGRDRVAADRREVRAILSGADERLLVIVGPCSAWPDEAVLEYARRLRELEPMVRDALKLVLRVYIQKPRTTRGWTGPLSQPDPFGIPDIAAGMRYCRRMMVEIVESGMAIADEALFTHNDKGFAELLSWIAIGARSSEDQEHRIWASAQDAAVGMKNPTSGDVAIGANGVVAAQHPHTAVFDGYQIETAGNPFAHLVLRGGISGPNHELSDLYRAKRELESRGVEHPVLLVDASHDNCRVDGRKQAEQQSEVVRNVLESLALRRELQSTVKGFLLESFLQTGAQDVTACTRDTVERGGLSITDPCLGWDRSQELLIELAARFRAIRDARVA